MRFVLIIALLFLVPANVRGAEYEPRPQEDGDQECRTSPVVWPPAGWHPVEVGQPLFRSETRKECLWAVLKADARVSEAGAYLRKGTLLWNAEGGRFCVREEATRYCVIDKNGDGRFDRSTTMGGSKGVNLTTPYDPVWIHAGELASDLEELVLLEIGADSIRAAQGGPGGSTELRYPLAQEGELTFGSRKLKVRRTAAGVEVSLP